MSLILRANLRQKCEIYFKNTKNLSCSYLRMNCYSNDVKRAVHNNQEYSQGKSLEIYDGILKRYIRNLKIFSLSSSAFAIAIQPYFIMQSIAMDSTMGIAGSIILGVLSITMTLLLHILTKRYVTFIYYDSERDKYLATTYSLFLLENKIEFTPDDVVIPEISGIFTTCLIKGKPLLFDENNFNDFNHYQKIMGFDKPIDYKLGNPNLNNVTTEENFSDKTENKR
ncbi:transmembrane protein 70 homolog, mitochondrial [Vespa velutina]|uniref:transmembrane protein 70 homolog, mitochondrial n=1 Tax=Vespa velutina TaxID=202808 RepID=UPI001FB335C0|nr:transmembrane protein 70 homolog, mitochondrial [Vespa velutina]